MTGGSDVNHATRSVENGFTFTMFLTPTAGMKKMFTGVRENLKKKGLPKPADDLFAFMPLVAVGETEEEALKFIKQVFWYVTNNKTEPQFRAPPGYVETELYANFLSGKFSGGRTDAIRTKGMDYFRENGVAVYGTPNQVVKQLKKMYKEIGGFGNLIAMLHSGDMPLKDVSKSMKLFAKEVVPQLKDLGTVSSKVGMLKDRGTPVSAKRFNGRTEALEAARAKSGVKVRSPRKQRKLAAA
tara:strand:- start:95 stop:817 length:723 start_codon:yes stop_codon:yes gene_type:complete